MKIAFVINNRNKGKYVGRAVNGALSQTCKCEIIVSDFSSTDDSCEQIQKAIDTCERGADHEIRFLHCPLPNPEAKMLSANRHMQWIFGQTDAEWIFQCSADDYSLPERVSVCMSALARLNRDGRDCVGLATTMYFENPEKPVERLVSGYPTEDGYVSAGIGIHKLAYGSTIWAYRSQWLSKVGLQVPCTSDVYLGYLASLDKGYYVIANPQHVHYMAHDLDNIGFQGKMRAAEKSGDRETMARINELNRFQLYELYLLTALKASELYPMAHDADKNAMSQMIINQSVGWYQERKNLHENKWTPGIL